MKKIFIIFLGLFMFICITVYAGPGNEFDEPGDGSCSWKEFRGGVFSQPSWQAISSEEFKSTTSPIYVDFEEVKYDRLRVSVQHSGTIIGSNVTVPEGSTSTYTLTIFEQLQPFRNKNVYLVGRKVSIFDENIIVRGEWLEN